MPKLITFAVKQSLRQSGINNTGMGKQLKYIIKYIAFVLILARSSVKIEP